MAYLDRPLDSPQRLTVRCAGPFARLDEPPSLSVSLGFYEPIRQASNDLFGLDPSVQMPVTSLLAGAASGAIGG